MKNTILATRVDVNLLDQIVIILLYFFSDPTHLNNFL
jgi:hypothetical protein